MLFLQADCFNISDISGLRMLLGIENKRVGVRKFSRSMQLSIAMWRNIKQGHGEMYGMNSIGMLLVQCLMTIVYAWVVCNPLNRDVASMMDGMMEVFGTLVSIWSDV